MKIQSYEQSIAPATPTVQSAPQVHPVVGAFGQQTNEALERSGDILANVSNKLMAHALEKQQQKDAADLANIDSNFMLSLQDKMFSKETEKVNVNGVEIERPVGFMHRELGAADGSAVEFEKYIAQTMPSLIGAGRTPEMQAKIKQRLMPTYLGARESVIKNEAVQSRKSHIDAIAANQLKRQQEAALIMNPASLTAALNISNDNADQMSNLKGLDETSAEIARKTDAAKMVEVSAESVLASPDGLNGALAMVEAGKEHMLPDTYKDMRASITSKWDALEKQRMAQADRVRTESKMKLVQKGATGGLTLSDFNDAAAAGVFESVEEMQKFKELAIKGMTGDAKTDATTLKMLFDEMQTLGTPSDEMKEKGKAGGKAILTKPKANVTAEQVAKYQGKVLQANRDGVLSQDDATNIIGATEKIYDMAIRGDVAKFKSPLQHFLNFIGTAQDDFDPDVASRKAELSKKYLQRAVIGGEDPDKVISDLKKENLKAQKHPSYAVFNGLEEGDSFTWNGKGYKYHGLGEDGEPQVEELK